MGYRVDYDELYDISEEIRIQSEDWLKQLEDMVTACTNLKNSQFFKGAAAENISAYFDEVHGVALGCLQIMVQDLYERSLSYSSLYRRDVDNGTHAVLHEQELKYDIPARINDLIYRTKDADYCADVIGKDVNDLVDLPNPGGSKLVDALEEARAIPLEVHGRVEKYEGAHCNDFTNIDELIEQVRYLLNKQVTRKRVAPISYTAGSLHTVCNIEKIQNAADAVESDIKDMESDFTAAMEERTAWDGELRAEREEKAKWIKIGVTAVCVAASIAVTVATGGAAAPLLLATVGAVEGAVMAGTNELTDQYVETGFRRGVDWNKVGKSVVVGGVTGFVTGYVGGSLALKSGVGKGIGNKILNETIKNVTKQTTKAVTGTLYDVVGGVVNPQSANSVGQILYNNFKDYPKSVVSGEVSAIVGTVSGEALDFVGDKLGDVGEKILKSTNAGKGTEKVMEYIGSAAWGGISETAEGVAKNLSSKAVEYTVFEGKDLRNDEVRKEFFGEVFSKDEIIGDAIEGAGGGIKDAYKDDNRKLQATLNEFKDPETGKVKFVYFGDDEKTVVLQRDYDQAVKLHEKTGKPIRDYLGTRTDKNPQFVSYDTSEVRAPYHHSDTKAVKAQVK